MSSFQDFLNEIPDMETELITIDDLISQYPLLTKEEPMLWVMYLKMNEGNLPEEEVKIVEKIIVKLQKNISIMNKRNLAKFENSKDIPDKDEIPYKEVVRY